MSFLVITLLIAVIFWWYSRANEIFRISVHNGKIVKLHGKIPTSLLEDFRGIVAQPVVSNATIYAYHNQVSFQLSISGVEDKNQEQRLRNVFYLHFR